MKRKERRHLKEDEFVSTISKVFAFIKKRTRELSIAGAFIAIAALVLVGIKLAKIQNIKKESRILAQILQVDSELTGSPEKINEIEKLSGNGKFSRLGYTRLASYWVGQGDLDKAIESLGKISNEEKDVLYYQAQDLLAQIYVLQKKYDRAIDIYQKMEEENPRSYSLDIILFHKAQAYEEMRDKEKALELYKRVRDEFPQTYFGFDASQKASKLEVRK